MPNPSVIVFDVNETLSDMSPLTDRFTEFGLPRATAALWFATLLRDGFALTAAGDPASFPQLAAEGVRQLLAAHEIAGDAGAAIRRVMEGLEQLRLHPDVVPGVPALTSTGRRLVTLSNGRTELADRLFRDAGIRDDFEQLLSVDGATLWKPARAAYEYAAAACRVPPEQMLLVAVHPWDIHGAAKAELRTAWLNRSGAEYPSYFTRPDYTIHALTDLPATLGAEAR